MNASSEITVLFTSAGRRVELLQCFRRAAEQLSVKTNILACDLNARMSAACQTADAAFDVPPCADPNYPAAIFEIARNHGANLVIPTIDPELMPLAKARPLFEAAGIRVHVSDPDFVTIAQNKVETSRVLAQAGVPVPLTQTLDTVREHPATVIWPAFLKPVSGSASRGVKIVSGPDDLPLLVPEPMLVQELLKGAEFTVNVFVDGSGTMRTVAIHRRLQVRAGEVEKGRTERRADMHQIAANIVAALPTVRGAFCFQLIDDEKTGLKVFEINARFGGGYPLADKAGATFAKWVLEETLGLPCTAHNDWRSGVTMLRYDAAVFSEGS